jgi:glycosyltransferase involved in cell wall biosynthesis
MSALVTIAIPVYKRLNYLPHVLRVVHEQDYPDIELIVSDNGQNGSRVQDLIITHYDRPFKFRQNPSTVQISTHFNQLIHEATGRYFLMLADDDEISPNYVSELVRALEMYPCASIAMSAQEIIDEAGEVTRHSQKVLPEILSGPEFIRAAWHSQQYGFECFATFLAKTKDLRECGGYPEFTRGTHNDDALVIKLCLQSHVVFSSRCTFRWRIYDSSHGWSIPIQDLADASNEFLQFLDSDPRIREFEFKHKAEWKVLKAYLTEMTWKTYWWRWCTMYRNRLSRLQWVKSACALKFIPAYYKVVIRTLFESTREAIAGRLKNLFSVS